MRVGTGVVTVALTKRGEIWGIVGISSDPCKTKKASKKQ